MTAATWVLAVATSILALSVPVAWFTWLGVRGQGKEQRQREREDRLRADVMAQASGKFVSQGAAVLAALIFGGALLSLWADRLKPPSA